ncbi:MAG TPA: MFS transporter [Polyangiaceae bacterium]|nr:MFS transporter [Polyangiaceae bacterium]
MSTAPASEDPDDPPLLTRDFALLLALQLAFGFAFSSFFLLPKYVVTELSGTASQVGYVGALAVVTAIMTAPFAGKVLARGPRRPIILLGSALTLLTSLAFLWVGALDGYLYAVRAVQGVAFTLFFVATSTMAADLAPPARLGQALGWLGSAALIMNAVATLAAEHIAHAYGWTGVFLASAGAGLLATLLATVLREPQSQGKSTPDRAPANGEVAQALRGRLAVLWAAVAGGAAFGVMFTFTQPFALSLGDTHVGPLFAGYTVTALLVRLVFGSLADRLGRARVGAVALAFYSLVVAATGGLEPGWLWALGLALGLAHGAFYPSLNALALEGATHQERGTITAYFIAAFNAGVLVVTFGLGQVAEAYGYPTLFLLVALLTASGCPLLFGQMRRKSWLEPSP